MVKADALRYEINKQLENIQDIDSLFTIDKFVKEIAPTTLEAYINTHYSEYNPAIRKELNHVVRKVWLDINNRFDPSSDYITHFSELGVGKKKQSLDLDFWIQDNYYLFNSAMLAKIIFKLWCKEIVWE